jgi:hypothetical protein
MSATTINSFYIANGITLSDATLTNTSTGTIVGGALTYAVLGTPGGADTVVNAGSIGATNYGVKLLAGYANRLVTDPGAVFSGTVSGGNTVGAATVSTLELASGASAATLAGLGSQFVNFVDITIDSGATWTLAADTLTAGYAVYNAGTLTNTGTLASAVTLGAGAALTNAASAVIFVAGTSAVYSGSSASGAVVSNLGTIEAQATKAVGILLAAGGVVSNAAHGLIDGYYGGVSFYYAAGSVSNQGTILSNQSGVFLGTGGTVSNAAGGTIAVLATASYAAVGIYRATGTVSNAGVIAGGYRTGVDLDDGGAVINLSGGTISATLHGIILGAGGSVTNQSGASIVATGTDGVFVIGLHGHTFTAGVSGYGISAAGSVTIVNQGKIVANATSGTRSLASEGIVLLSLSDVTNQSGGMIAGGYVGVRLTTGGVVINQAGGTISSGGVGVVLGYGTVANAGTISGGGAAAVEFTSGLHAGRLIVDPGAVFGGTVFGNGTLLATLELASASLAGTLSGLGSEYSNFGRVTIDSGATWTLAASADLSIEGNALYQIYDAGTLTNTGTLASSITLDTGATLINAVGGDITSAREAVVFGPDGGTATLVNAGTIANDVYPHAVLFGAGGANRLVVDPGAVFTGVVDGGNSIGATAVSTLELASAASAGTLSGLGSTYIDFAQTTVDSGARWTLTGTNTVAAAATLTNAGTLTLSGATLTDAGALVNNGGIVLDPSTMTVASLTGTGTVTIEAGGTLVVTGSIGGGETIMFAGSGAYLDLQSPTSVAGSVSNFAFAETIDLTGINPSAVSYSDGELQFNGSAAFPFALASGNTLQVGASHDGTELTALCFCIDTMIATPSGQVKVQDLAVGDLVMTLRGEVRPIMWIGAGTVLATRGRRNAATPVIVRKGALGDNVPCHDLRVTKGHSLYLDHVLIPAEFLVNHRSIAWDDRAQEVALYHLELASHDVLLANGAPAESYRDDGNRWLFRNVNSGWDLPPQEACAPVLTGGPIVDAVWRRLLERSGPRPALPLTSDADLHLLVDGRRLDAVGSIGNIRIFNLPESPNAVRIRSRAAAPQEIGLARDPRPLGVGLQRLVVRQGTRFRVFEAADALLTVGFHAYEAVNGFRWTNGDATAPTELFAGFAGPMEILLTVASTAHYVEEGIRRQAA